MVAFCQQARRRHLKLVESYIVRIYRREPKEPWKIAGVVEVPGSDQKRAFASSDALLEILGGTIKSHGSRKDQKGERYEEKAL